MLKLKAMIEYTKKFNILYVEDDLELLKETQELLENYFLHLDVACNGQEGLDKYTQYYESNNKTYDIVLTDISMPKINGIEMSKEILKINDLQAIIIISAHNEVDYLMQAINIGINGFITKPINNEQLINVLYKVSQAVSDHNYVHEHIQNMEDLVLQLEKSSRLLDTIIHKPQRKKSKSTRDNVVTADKTSSFMKEQVQDLVNYDLEELCEIQEEIDVNLINVLNEIHNIDKQSIEKIIVMFERYSSILTRYNFFDELSYSMKEFVQALKDNELPQEREVVENIFMLLESFMYVLGKWHSDLKLGDESKINALDASLISDLGTITNMWIQKEHQISEEEVDGIFDF